MTKQLMYRENFCTHCDRCTQPCDHEECQYLGRCVHACMNGCLSIVGEEVDSDRLADRLRKHAELLRMLGGGITISGGEPLLQPEFVCELTDRLPEVHKAIQTSGYAKEEVYRKVIGRFDYVMQDIKLADSKPAANHLCSAYR